MKKLLSLVLFMAVSVSTFAQLLVKSNGEIIGGTEFYYSSFFLCCKCKLYPPERADFGKVLQKSGKKRKRELTDFVDIGFEVTLAYVQLTDVQTCCYTQLELCH